MSIPFVDLKAQYAEIKDQVLARINTVLEHGRYVMGPEIGELEAALAEFTGAKHVLTCASGTDALLMALMAFGVGPGDAVFTTPFTFVATAEAIALAGATPVFVDIDEKTFNLDPSRLATAVEHVRKSGKLKPRGIIPVDLFGQPAEYDAITEIAGREDLFVVADAAQSFGATYKGRRVGTLGHITATSFFPAKPLGGYGDGGAVFTDDGALAAKLGSIRVHGQGENKYDNVRLGLNARMDTLQAAILLPKLGIFPDELAARDRLARAYSEGLCGIVETPRICAGRTSAWAQYSVLVEDRDEIHRQLDAKGIPTAIYYPKPLHLQQAFANLGYEAGDFAMAESVAHRILSLPMHPYLTQDQIDSTVQCVNAAVALSPRAASA